MEFKEGRRVILNGSLGQLRHVMHYLPVMFYQQGKKVLVVDTVNSLNPHHPFFNTPYQDHLFKNIFCVRTPMPYDLWARLGTTKSFIAKRRISVLLITSLSLLFKEESPATVEPILTNILKRVDYLTQTHNLITVIANSPYHDDAVMLASSLLSEEDNVQEVEV